MQTSCSNLFYSFIISHLFLSYNIQEGPIMGYALNWVLEPEKKMAISIRRKGIVQLESAYVPHIKLWVQFSAPFKTGVVMDYCNPRTQKIERNRCSRSSSDTWEIQGQPGLLPIFPSWHWYSKSKRYWQKCTSVVNKVINKGLKAHCWKTQKAGMSERLATTIK